MKLRRFRRGPGSSRLNDLVDAINEPLVGDGIIQVNGRRLSINLRELRRRLALQAVALRRARAQENAGESSMLQAKLLNAADTETEEITVHTLDASVWNTLSPCLENGDVFVTCQIGHAWYGVGFAAAGRTPGTLKRAYANEDAGANQGLSVHLVDDNEDVTAYNVHGKAWYDLFPLLFEGDYLFVTQIGGTYYGTPAQDWRVGVVHSE